MSVSVRVASPADIPLILQFIRDLADYERMLDEVEATEADIRRDLFGENPRCFCDIAEQDGAPVGFALWFYNYSTFRGREWAVLNWNAPSIAFYDSLGATTKDDWTVRRLDGAALAKLAEG